MARYQFLVIPLLACGALLLTHSAHQPILPLLALPAPEKLVTVIPILAMESVPLPGEWTSARPLELLDQAVARYHPNKINWLDMTFRQQSAYEDVVYAMTGRILTGPSQFLRFQMEMQLGNEKNQFLYICDGKKLVEICSLGGHGKQVKTVPMPKIQRPTDDPASIARDRDLVLQGKCFKGIGPLLTSVRSGLQDAQLKAVRYQGEEFLEIKGKWVVPKDKIDAVSKQVRPDCLPRQCRVYLDAKTLWPRYLEWWGNNRSNPANMLLVRTEFSPATINQPLTPEEMEKEFSVAEKGPERQ